MAKRANYWDISFPKRQAELRGTLTKPWAQSLFNGLANYVLHQSGAPAASLKLPKLAGAVKAYELVFSSLNEITAQSLIDKFSTSQLRKHEILMRYLHSLGVELPTQEQLKNNSEQSRIHNIVRDAQAHSLGSILAEYLESLSDLPNLTTRRLYLGAALGLTTLVGQRALEQKHVLQFIKAKPGQRNSLSRYIVYLNSKGFEVSVPGKRKPRPRVIPRPEDMLKRLVALSNNSNSIADLRAAIAGLLSSTSGLPLEQILQLRRSDVIRTDNDQLLINLEGSRQLLVEPLHTAMTHYLAVRDRHAQASDTYLFIGRPTFRPATSTAIRSHLSKHEILLSPLSMRARRSILREATRID